MPKTQFNWSMLDRNVLYSMLYPLGKEIVGKPIPVNELQKKLSKHIKQHLPIKISQDRDPHTEKTWVYIGGYYYSENDQQGGRPIEILFSYNPLDKFITITSYRWRRMAKLFADTMLHEIIHMRQYRSRNFKHIPGYESYAASAKDRKNQEYYGHKDELGAYSFNIACELTDKFGQDYKSINDYLDTTPKKYKKSSYYRYLESFNWNHKHPIIRKLKTKIKKNLPYAQIGKPFANNNYLTY